MDATGESHKPTPTTTAGALMFYYLVPAVTWASGRRNPDAPAGWSGYYYAPDNAYLIVRPTKVTPLPAGWVQVGTRADLEAACRKYGVPISDVDRLIV